MDKEPFFDKFWWLPFVAVIVVSVVYILHYTFG